MGFKSVDLGIASSIYLALYTIYLLFTIKIVATVGIKTIYTSLLIFGIIRICGQFSGIAFAALGIEHYQWLIAYLVFSAEGYFVLILTSFHFVARSQKLVLGNSWLRPSDGERKNRCFNGSNRLNRVRSRLTWSRIFHFALLPANALIVAGGSMLAGLTQDELKNDSSKVNTTRVMRSVGQAVFLSQTVIVIFLAIFVYFRENVRIYAIKAIFFASPFLLTRGIFGILSIYIDKMNYFKITNYSEDGFDSDFVAYEYCLATTTEFIVAIVLISNFYVNRYFDKRYDYNDEEKTDSTEVLNK